jgi:two-component sensor histidine kinase
MKFLKILAFFLFVINSFSQVKENDSIAFSNFLIEKDYLTKKNIYRSILTDNPSIKTTKEWLNFFKNEETKYKNSFSELYFITLCKVYLLNHKGFYEKSNEIITQFYYKNKNVSEKDKLCILLNILYKNCIRLNKVSELIIINKERLQTCFPSSIAFYDIYSKVGLLDLAIKNYKEAKFYQKNGTNFESGKNQNNIGVFFKRGKKYDSAFYYFDKSLTILDKLKEKDFVKDQKKLNFWIALVKGNLGECYLEFKEYDKALDLFIIEEKESKKFYQKRPWIFQDDYYKNMATCYLNTGKLSLAKKYIDSLLYKKNDFLYSKLKSEYFSVTKRYDSVYYYNKIYVEISDSIAKQEKKELNSSFVKLIDFQEELASQEFKIIEAQKENKLNKRDLIVISIILVISLLFIVTLINLIYKKNIQKGIIEKQNVSINNSLSEKNILLSELHHRVKNNFQVMISILNLQLQKIKNSEFKDTFQYSINRVTTIARIHDKLLKNDNLSRIPLYNYIENIVDDLKIIYNSLHAVKININIDPKLLIYIDQTQALGLIINELITNSYQYAFSNQKDNLINIAITEKEGVIYFNYSDNGIGFDLNKINKNNFIGITLLQRLVNQLGTTANITPKDGMKITFSFTNKLER